MHLRILSFIPLWVTLLAFNTTINADDASPSEVGQADLTLRQFVKGILDTNPRVKAARTALLSDKATRDAETQPLYNPDFTLNAEDSDSLSRTIGISQTLDWSGKRKARSQVADSNLLYAETEFQAIRRAFVVELLNGLASYQIGTARHALVLERQSFMNDLVDLAQSRFEAGDISRVELDLVKLAAMSVRMRSASVESNNLKARQVVQVLTLQTHKDNWPSLPEDIPNLPENIDSDMFVQQLPEVLMAKLSVQINDSIANLRRSERRPDPTVSLKGGKEDDELAIGLNVTIPLFVRNSFKHEVSAAEAERTESELIAHDVLQRARIRIENTAERFAVLRSAWVDWRSTSEESLTRPLDQLHPLWEKGELTTTDYVIQLTEILVVRENALDLNESLWQAWFEWLLVSGQIDVWLGLDT